MTLPASTLNNFQPSTMYGDSYSDQKRVKVFSSNLDDMLKKYGVKKLELVDLLFIPILQGDHFYCMCFHMKTGQVEILDNSTAEQDFDDRYKGLPNTLKRVLILYLKQKSRATAAINELEKSAIIRKKMDWRTLNNGIDCGIFTMRHMETYKGKTPWTCGLVKEADESIGQWTQIHLLRHRYLSKIILFDYNLQRQKIIKSRKHSIKGQTGERICNIWTYTSHLG